jgi:RNase P/RNase MRP subunit POP5
MPRYRMEPCGYGNVGTATYRIVDTTLSPQGTGICEASHDNAKKIAAALNAYDDTPSEDTKKPYFAG